MSTPPPPSSSLLGTTSEREFQNNNEEDDEQQEAVDQLTPLVSYQKAVPLKDHSSTKVPNSKNNKHSQLHVQTYTAGEDNSRLADMAKEFGLQHQRAPRKQVRRRTSFQTMTAATKVVSLLLDPSFEDIRMRAVYSSHADYEEEELENRVVLERWNASWARLEQEEPEKEEEQEPVEDAHAAGLGGNLTSAVLGIIKGMVGPAILYLPHGFASAGYIVALPIMAAATVLYLHSSRCLLDSWKRESDMEAGIIIATDNNGVEEGKTQQQVMKHNEGGLPSVGEAEPLTKQKPQSHFQVSTPKKRHVLLSYPELAYRAFGTRGESVVKLGIALMQSGVCLTYLIFVPQNLHTSLLLLFGWNVSPEYWLVLMILIQIPLSWIRDIRKFTLTNLIANGLILYGLITCLGFALGQATSDGTAAGPVASVFSRLVHLNPFASQWFLFIGTSVLLFEGSITLMVPLQEAVQEPKDRAAFPSVYTRVILGIICFYAFFGITCWMSFGDQVRTVLTTSLPAGFLATTVQLAYSVAVIFTFPLQNFPALEIACRSIAKSLSSRFGIPRRGTLWTKRDFIASVLVCALAVVAVTTMDSLDRVVSLMGSLLGCPIAFVFPPLIHTKLVPDLSPWRKRANYAVAGLGFVAMIMASITTILQW